MNGNRKRWLSGGCLLVVVLLGGCAAREPELALEVDPSFEREEWTFRGKDGAKLTTRHYEIYTTVQNEELLEAVPQAVETAYAYYNTLVPTVRGPLGRMPVYVFVRRAEWEAFTQHRFPARAPVLTRVRYGGYAEEGVAVIEYVSNATTFPILGHEGFHQYISQCATGRIPAWLNEGLAVLCEGQRWSANGLDRFDPWYNPIRQNRLADALVRDELIPLEELLSINAGHVIGGTSRRIGTYYAQLWALMLFLQEGQEGRYAEGFQRLVTAAGSEDLDPFAKAAHAASDEPQYDFGRAVFRSFIAEDLATVEYEYDGFMRERILGAKVASARGGDGAAGTDQEAAEGRRTAGALERPSVAETAATAVEPF